MDSFRKIIGVSLLCMFVVPLNSGFSDNNEAKKERSTLKNSDILPCNEENKKFLELFRKLEIFLRQPKDECAKKVMANEKMEKEILSFGAKLEQLLKEGKVKKEDEVEYRAWSKLWHKLCELEDEIKKRRDLESGVVEYCAKRFLDDFYDVLNFNNHDGVLSRELKKSKFYEKWKYLSSAIVSDCMFRKENLNEQYNEIEVKVTKEHPYGTVYDIKTGKYKVTEEHPYSTEYDKKQKNI